MIKKSLLVLTMGSALFAGVAYAQSPGPMLGEGQQMHAQDHEHAQKGHADHFAKRYQHRMDKLKQSLKLSQEQGPAWTAFEGVMHPADMPRPDHDAVRKMTTPERLDFMASMKAQHDAQMQKRLNATRTFYAALTPEQKKTFDQETEKFMANHDHRGYKHSERQGR